MDFPSIVRLFTEVGVFFDHNSSFLANNHTYSPRNSAITIRYRTCIRFPIIDHASQSLITRNAFSKCQEFTREYEIRRLCSSSRTWQTISGEKYAARFDANSSLECKLVALLRTRLVGARMSFFCSRRLEHSAFAHKLVA